MALAAIRSVITYVAVLAYIAIAGPIGLLFAIGVPLEARTIRTRAHRRAAGAEPWPAFATG